MRSTRFFKFALVCLAMTLVTGAFAASDTQKGNFQIADPVQVNGTQLPAGDYVARWQGTGDNVKVDITRNGKVLASVPAKAVELGQKASADAAEVVNGAGGKRELSTLRFSGKKVQLELGSPTAEARGIK